MENKSNKNITRIEFLSWIGSLIVVIAYFMTSFEITDKKYIMDILNIIGSVFLAYLLYIKKVWSSLALELVWIFISIISLIKNLLK
tara:strand:+ start:2871 stop:3128 length:258 start_codon:yes stop_codon:yes gene_type:complete